MFFNFCKVATVAVSLRCGADLWRGVFSSFVCQTSCLAKLASQVSSKKSCRTHVSAQCLYACTAEFKFDDPDNKRVATPPQGGGGAADVVACAGVVATPPQGGGGGSADADKPDGHSSVGTQDKRGDRSKDWRARKWR